MDFLNHAWALTVKLVKQILLFYGQKAVRIKSLKLLDNERIPPSRLFLLLCLGHFVSGNDGMFERRENAFEKSTRIYSV
jgi:hypothetical protein